MNRGVFLSSSLCETLLVVFIVLKLCNVIDWSWTWVLSPFWIPVIGVIGIIFIAILVAMIADRKAF